MESEASTSSPKRSASQDPQAAQANDMTASASSKTASTITDADIDAYMAEQGEDRGVGLPTWTPARKLQHVEAAMKRQMASGEIWCVVSRRWYTRWRKAMTGDEDKEGGIEEKDVGPVDNTALCNAAGEVTSPFIEHVDSEFVPEDTWKLFEEWCVPLGLQTSRVFWCIRSTARHCGE